MFFNYKLQTRILQNFSNSPVTIATNVAGSNIQEDVLFAVVSVIHKYPVDRDTTLINWPG